MMNPEYKTKWIEALRSGKYTQTQGCLRNHSGYCCLGVLCDVAGVEWEEQKYADDIYFDANAKCLANGRSFHNITNDLLPRVVADIAGLNIEDEYFLTNLNDNLNFSFEEIAKVIEEKF